MAITPETTNYADIKTRSGRVVCAPASASWINLLSDEVLVYIIDDAGLLVEDHCGFALRLRLVPYRFHVLVKAVPKFHEKIDVHKGWMSRRASYLPLRRVLRSLAEQVPPAGRDVSPVYHHNADVSVQLFDEMMLDYIAAESFRLRDLTLTLKAPSA